MKTTLISNTLSRLGHIALGTLAVAASLSLGGCALPPDGETDVDVMDDEMVGQVEEELSINHNAADEVHVWDSGNGNCLSAWMPIGRPVDATRWKASHRVPSGMIGVSAAF